MDKAAGIAVGKAVEAAASEVVEAAADKAAGKVARRPSRCWSDADQNVSRETFVLLYFFRCLHFVTFVSLCVVCVLIRSE